MTEIIQGSPEWFAIRAGKVTASRVADVIAKTQKGWGAGRANYAAELICERLTGTVGERFQNDAMRWGNDMEPQARNAYAFVHDVDVAQIGFVIHPSIEMSGASPDGLVGETGLIEIKCPNTATHLDTLEACTVPSKYLTQMMWQMACTGRQWCDFVSYDPRLPEPMQMFVARVHRDDAAIAELEAAVRDFLTELDARVAKLRSLYDLATAA